MISTKLAPGSPSFCAPSLNVQKPIHLATNSLPNFVSSLVDTFGSMIGPPRWRADLPHHSILLHPRDACPDAFRPIVEGRMPERSSRSGFAAALPAYLVVWLCSVELASIPGRLLQRPVFRFRCRANTLERS